MPRRLSGAPLLVILLLLAFASHHSEAGFAGTDVLIPAVARAGGLFGSEFYSQVWVTNLAGSTLAVSFAFLQRDQSNTAPRTFSAMLDPYETRRFDNAVEAMFGVSGTSGAVRVTAAGPILVSSRTYNLPPGGDPSQGQGLFFTGIPCTFAIGAGETAQLQGVTQGAAENFRYNFGLVNVEPGPATVRVSLRNPAGTALGEKSYDLRAYEAAQYNVTDVVPGLVATNGLLWATVTGGTGRVVLYGTQIANGSNDSAGFEMSFKNSLLSAGGGVTSLNGLTGALTLAAGANVTLTPSGSVLTIAAAGGGGFSLPYGGTFNEGNYVLWLDNTGAGAAVYATAKGEIAIAGSAGSSTFVHSSTGGVGVGGAGSGMGVSGMGGTYGVYGWGSTGVGGYGAPGVVGYAGNASTDGVFGEAQSFAATANGVRGKSVSGNGVLGESTNGYGVHGVSASGDGLFGEASAAQKSGVFATTSNPSGHAAFLRGHVGIVGTLDVSGGTKNFLIDHPLDPENRVLRHAAVESGEALNVYSGNVVLDATGAAVVRLPEWLEAINRDFRYVLTPVGGPAPDLHVAAKVANGRFRIGGGRPFLEVSWQVTGVRHDAFMRAHPFATEEDKSPEERGRYLTPVEHGQPPERDVEWARRPELMRRLKEQARTTGSPAASAPGDAGVVVVRVP